MNNKGQALIESLIVGLVLVSALYLLIRYALMAQQSLMVDEFIEQTLICKAEKKVDCIGSLRSRLTSFHFKSISIQDTSVKNKVGLHLTTVSGFDQKVEKESELELDLQVAN